MRTLLTIITLTLLTFTTQAFTSVQSYLKFYQIPRGNSPTYEGVLLRDRGWKGLQQSVLDYATSAFGKSASVLPRSWFASQVIGERAYIDIEKLDNTKKSFASALHGVTEAEGALIGFESFLHYTRKSHDIKMKDFPFKHGVGYELPSGVTLYGAYHPSPRNVNTKRITFDMMVKFLKNLKNEI